jgi:hypothetical protein
MTLNYDFNEEDLFRWYQYSLKASPIVRKARRLYVVRWLMLYVCVATAIVLFFQTYIAAFICYSLAVVFTFTALHNFDQRMDAATKEVAAEDPLFKKYLGHCQLKLSEVGVREVTPASDKTFEWQSVIGALRDGDYVFVRVATGEDAMIPRQSYSGPVPFEEIPQAVRGLKQKYLT